MRHAGWLFNIGDGGQSIRDFRERVTGCVPGRDTQHGGKQHIMQYSFHSLIPSLVSPEYAPDSRRVAKSPESRTEWIIVTRIYKSLRTGLDQGDAFTLRCA